MLVRITTDANQGWRHTGLVEDLVNLAVREGPWRSA